MLDVSCCEITNINIKTTTGYCKITSHQDLNKTNELLRYSDVSQCHCFLSINIYKPMIYKKSYHLLQIFLKISTPCRKIFRQKLTDD